PAHGSPIRPRRLAEATTGASCYLVGLSFTPPPERLDSQRSAIGTGALIGRAPMQNLNLRNQGCLPGRRSQKTAPDGRGEVSQTAGQQCDDRIRRDSWQSTT